MYSCYTGAIDVYYTGSVLNSEQLTNTELKNLLVI
jgi:hypothetical protein